MSEPPAGEHAAGGGTVGAVPPDGATGPTASAGPPAAAAGRGRRLWWVWTLAAFAAAGVVAGLVWTLLSATVHLVVTGAQPPLFPVSESDAGLLIRMDGWYAVLAAAFGVGVGAPAATLLRRRGPLGVVAIAVGAAVAAVLSLVVGTLVADGAVLFSWTSPARPGTVVVSPLLVRAYGVLAIWPIAALLPTFFVGWVAGPAGRPAAADAVERPPGAGAPADPQREGSPSAPAE